MVVSRLSPSEGLRDRSTPVERPQEEEWASLSLAHSSSFFSSSLPLTTKLPLPSSFFFFLFLSIFRPLVGKPNTCVIKITHSAVDWPDISIQGWPKIYIQISYNIALSNITDSVTFETNQRAFAAFSDDRHVLKCAGGEITLLRVNIYDCVWMIAIFTHQEKC